MGVVILIDLGLRFTNVGAFYSDYGAVPRHAVSEHLYRSWNLSIHFITGGVVTESILFLINAIFIICFIIGYRARLMSILCWFFYMSLSNRNPLVAHGGDTLVRMMLFWSMFVPLGISYSVDAALRKTSHITKKLFSPGIMAMMLQLLFVYFFSAIHKTDAQWFPEGTAIAYALQLHAFATPIGIYFRQFPLLLKSLTLSTYLLEMLGPVFMLIPFGNMRWRLPIILGFLGLHFGIFLTMKIGMFPWMCIAAWMLFLPPELWNWISDRLIKKSGKNVQIFFDADCGFCKKSVYIIRHLLLIEDAFISEGQSDPDIIKRMREKNSWIVRDSSGTHHDRYNAFLALVGESPLVYVLKPIVSFLPVRWIGSKLYHWVSHHREIAGHLTRSLQWNEKPYRYTKMHTGLVVFFMLLVLLNNLDTVKWKNFAAAHLFRVPQPLKMVNRIFRTDQAWDMFAPRPLGTNSWYLIEGTTLSGKDVILMNEDPRENPKRPADFENLTDNHRWSKYSRNLAEDNDETYLLHYGKYLCRKTNRKLKGKDALEKFTIKLIKQKTSLDTPQPYRESILWKHRCLKSK